MSNADHSCLTLLDRKFVIFIFVISAFSARNDRVQCSVWPNLDATSSRLLGTNALYALVQQNHGDGSQQFANGLLRNRKPQQQTLAANGSFDCELTQAPARNSTNNEVADKRKFIRQMMKNAWDGYARYAWGFAQVKPHSKAPSSDGVFGGNTKLGATIIDALDTLWIMGLRKEFESGRDWVAADLRFDELDNNVSVFEVTIRLLGGLLSAFGLSNDTILRQKAYDLGKHLLPAFDGTATGFPYASYNFKRKTGSFPGGNAILSEIGSLHMEFAYLSNITNDTSFVEKTLRVRAVLDRATKRNGLYSNFVGPDTGQFHSTTWYTSVGACGDSFYEYLLKSWLLSARTDSTAKRMFDEAISAIDSQLVRTSIDGHVYFIKLDGEKQVHDMEHLACFMKAKEFFAVAVSKWEVNFLLVCAHTQGGLYALGAPYAATPKTFTLRGAQIADTCHAAYAMTKTKIGPDNFQFIPGQAGIQIGNPAYLLRPEVIETWFVMWRRTRDPKYREWGWVVAQAIEKYCRAEAGYAGLRDINNIAQPPTDNQDDVQYSYFLAESLKYLYLLFVDEKTTENGSVTTSTAADDGGVDISLEEFVFNTEAHPLPIYGTRTYAPFVPSDSATTIETHQFGLAATMLGLWIIKFFFT